jgi:hypothetical protein
MGFGAVEISGICGMPCYVWPEDKETGFKYSLTGEEVNCQELTGGR